MIKDRLTVLNVKNPKITEGICRKYLRKALCEVENGDICFLRAVALMKLGRNSEALEQLIEINRRETQNFWYLQYLAILYFRNGFYSKAFEEFKKAEALQPFNSVSQNNVSVCYLKLNNMLTSDEFCNRRTQNSFEAENLLEPYFDSSYFPFIKLGYN